MLPRAYTGRGIVVNFLKMGTGNHYATIARPEVKYSEFIQGKIDVFGESTVAGGPGIADGMHSTKYLAFSTTFDL